MPAEHNYPFPGSGKQVPYLTETATFAMGCFWKPDALFGSLQGVVHTRVGYAGGTTDDPTYWKLADHIETVQLEYDPARISYPELLTFFFQNHNPTLAPWKRQYKSAVFYHTPAQKTQAEEALSKLEAQLNRKLHTALYPYQAFYRAEDRHQKYKLQRQAKLLEAFNALYPKFIDLVDSTAAARVNGYLYGYGNPEKLKASLRDLSLPAAVQEELLDAFPPG